MGTTPPLALGRGRGRALTESLWLRGELRALALARSHPHAAKPLAFYVEILRAQEPLAFHSRLPEWLDLVGQTEMPLLRLERLPVDELIEDMHRFIDDVSPAATPALTEVGKDLAANSELRARVLGIFLTGGSWDPLEALGWGEERLVFFPWAFLQPIALGLSRLASADSDETRGSAGDDAGAPDLLGAGAPRADDRGSTPLARTCPTCGRPPLAGTIGDEPDHLGRRRLLCSLCSTAWPFPRLTCAACLETDPDKLEHHVSDSWPHVRIDACRSCDTYLKTIDHRAFGDVVESVDELASLELDLWADEHGLKKLQRNLLGF